MRIGVLLVEAIFTELDVGHIGLRVQVMQDERRDSEPLGFTDRRTQEEFRLPSLEVGETEFRGTRYQKEQFRILRRVAAGVEVPARDRAFLSLIERDLMLVRKMSFVGHSPFFRSCVGERNSCRRKIAIHDRFSHR